MINNNVVEQILSHLSSNISYHLLNILTIVIFIGIVSLWNYKKNNTPKKILIKDSVKSFIVFFLVYIVYSIYKAL